VIVKLRINVYLEPSLLGQVETLARRQKLSKSHVIESAVASLLSADSADRFEAAFARRLNHLTRQVERVERSVAISTEALALFVKFWLTTTPPVPDRYASFVQALGRRLASGQSIIQEISGDIVHEYGNS
jgi:hypothetical protein